VFVYRDTAGQPGDSAPNDPSYWYDLSGTGPAEETPHVSAEARGPFEPLVSSADPPGTVRPSAPDTGDGEDGGDAASGADAAAGAPGTDGQENLTHAHARKLEQIKDLYLTAEAIGEANVDKHFDQLLSQQRELISEYFRQSSTSPAPGAADETPAEADEPRAPEPPATGSWFIPENAQVAADQPRAW
jgi:hypothetical protein